MVLLISLANFLYPGREFLQRSCDLLLASRIIRERRGVIARQPECRVPEGDAILGGIGRDADSGVLPLERKGRPSPTPVHGVKYTAVMRASVVERSVSRSSVATVRWPGWIVMRASAARSATAVFP
jgi:hypothetical protein